MLSKAVRTGPRRWARMTRIALEVVRLERRLRRTDVSVIARSMGVSTDPDDPVPTSAIVFSLAEAERIQDVQRVLGHGPFNNTCLRQSLLVGSVLGDRDVRLRLGVKKVAGEVKAHAWLLVDGHCLDGYEVVDGPASGFAVLPIDVEAIR